MKVNRKKYRRPCLGLRGKKDNPQKMIHKVKAKANKMKLD